MKLKVCLCYLLCLSLLLCATACSKNQMDGVSSSIELIYEEVVYDENIQNTQSETENSLPTNSVQSNLTSSSKPETKFDFTSIESIDYVCSKDIPGFESEYTIERLITDSQENIVHFSEFTCDTEGVRIEKNKIYVPNDIRNSVSQILITATHKESGISEIFDITFDGNWSLIFEDDFNGTQINSSIWEHYPEWKMDKGHKFTFSNDLTFLDGNGNLISRAFCSNEKDEEGNQKYFSGAIRTKGLFETTYGYYEIRVKPHQITGAWGSFWIVAGDMEKPVAYDNLSLNGVVLCLEMYKKPNNVNYGCAWDGMDEEKYVSASSRLNTYLPNVAKSLFDGNYHTLAVRWNKDEYIYYVDGMEGYRVLAIGGACNQPGYLNISTEYSIGAGDIPLGAGEYSEMIVDYVKIYQNSNDPV